MAVRGDEMGEPVPDPRPAAGTPRVMRVDVVVDVDVNGVRVVVVVGGMRVDLTRALRLPRTVTVWGNVYGATVLTTALAVVTVVMVAWKVAPVRAVTSVRAVALVPAVTTLPAVTVVLVDPVPLVDPVTLMVAVDPVVPVVPVVMIMAVRRGAVACHMAYRGTPNPLRLLP
ncbi:hypothetical protein AB0C95_00560 [Streptomyces caniferus]|uniref:hypothetical protein n=1 Tax=Streptomyces caniferus TaxID=285557 RepID=UPI0033EE2EBC